ncbi:alpha-mannosidase [Streptomyces synnematoformans]|uniref:Glycoside hydrolase family 38 C-terminal domain-containing protein n=1 Tax=Streptomyces synnematoformans TaxID=415721 RepID=A0ABN2Y462_9ACTN
MHNAPRTTLDRLERALRQRLVPRIHTRLSAVDVSAWPVDGDGEPVPAAHALGLAPLPGRSTPVYEPLAPGDPWGPAWGTTWLRVDGTVPEEARRDPARTTELVLELGWEDHSVGGQAEGMLYRPDGSVIKAVHPRSGWLRLTGPGASPGVLRADGTFTVYVEAAANPLVLGLPPFVTTPLGDKLTAGPAPLYRLARAEVCDLDAGLWELVRDLEVAGGLAAEVSEDEPRHWRLLRAVDAALDAAGSTSRAEGSAGGRDLDATAPRARAALAPELAKPAHASAHRITAVGHAHIDAAWLWPLRETVRKVARTVANVLTLMDSDPDFVFAMSSAQQFAWLEEHYPELFERVRARVAEGRFVPVGGMWVESDTTMPSGEAMVRQFTHGRRYFTEKLGVEPEEVWLPDSFGYSGALPQLARLAGFRWFLTQKISWNDTNAFPHHTFWWEGIDGSRVFTHFPPADTYAAEVTAAELHHSVASFRDKAASSHSLVPFGYGDGGGGPTREMLARAARFADLEGAPRVAVREPAAFFADAEEEYGDGAPVWVGELYLELHRGTFTSQHAMKAGNRRCEALLRTAEYLAASAAVRTGAEYPAAELDEIWRTVLLHQFHDILPGSSISWVHREARATYEDLTARLTALIDRSGEQLAGSAGATAADRTARIISPLPWAGRGAWETAPAGPAGGEAVRLAPLDGGGHELDNGLLRAVVDAAGHVVSLRDAATGRELVPEGRPLGVLQLHRDEPVRWDAWDIDRDAARMRTDLTGPASVTARTREDGTAEVAVEHTAGLPGGSRLTLTIRLAPGERQLGMELDADWRERERLLKVALPLAVHTTTARHETQFGHVERTIHANTSWDAAHYEDCAHRYVHVAEPGFGVGVVNDSVYGCDVTRLGGPGGGAVVRLSLLRAPTFPDPETDLGVHRMRWAVVPGEDHAATVAAAHALGAPVVEGLPAVEPLLRLDDTAGLPVLDTVKLADDGSGDLVARVYEARGGRAEATLRWADVCGADAVVRETDLLERDLTDGSGIRRALRDGNRLSLDPFQVVTLRLTPAAECEGAPR